MKNPPFCTPGERIELGSHTFTAQEIIRFARKFDPQPFHIDEEAAHESVLGGLCASGWHTAAVWMRKFRDCQAAAYAQWMAEGNPPYDSGPSPGFKNMRWIRPVYVGDTISYANVTHSWRASASRPGWFVYTGVQEGMNQKGEAVFSFESAGFLRYPAE